MRDSKSPSAGYHYFSKSDSGLAAEELRKEVGGLAAERLGLDKDPDFDHFKNLLHGLDPHTGEQLTAKLVEGRISYWDITATVPKGVTIAIERGDPRVHDALWEAGRETMADLERFITTRERKGGAQDNRVTGNMIWYGFEHPETRPAKADGVPDPDRHIHFVVPNLTWDAKEEQWKAIKFRPVMDLRKWFDRRFDMRLASKLTDLGYGIETKYKPDPRGGKRYFSWDIAGMPESLERIRVAQMVLTWT
jgi:conjugative relaxase-like TrwC/TraI family protein